MDDINPAGILTRGVSDDAKQKVTEKLQEIQDRKNQIQPECDRITREHEELLQQVQNSQQNSKDAKQQIQAHQKIKSKLENYKRKLREAQKRLETDNEEEKRKILLEVKQRVVASLKAMGEHSNSYKKMMEATVKASGAKLNKEVTTVEERISRYELFQLCSTVDKCKDKINHSIRSISCFHAFPLYSGIK